MRHVDMDRHSVTEDLSYYAVQLKKYLSTCWESHSYKALET